MPRTLSQTATRAIYAQETGECFVILLTLSGSTGSPVRVCSGGADCVSGGVTYSYCPFEINLLDDTDTLPVVTLRLDNIDRTVVEAINDIVGVINVDLSVVLASSPSVVEAGPFALALRFVSIDAQVAEAQLMAEDLLNEPYPADLIRPDNFPGAFA